MTAGLRQWDIVKVRINPADRDEHPAIIVSPDELCADPHKTKLNVLYGTTRRPGQAARPHEVVLNGVDGLDHATVFNCVYFFGIDRQKIASTLGRVTGERRRQIGRTVVASYRFPL